MNERKNNRRRYLTVERFETFLNNEFYHLKVRVGIIFWVVLAILAAIIASWATGS